MNGISAYRPLTGLPELEKGFLKALQGSIKDKTAWLAYADWLEEQDRTKEAWEARAKAGVCRVSYYVRCLLPNVECAISYSVESNLVRVLRKDASRDELWGYEVDERGRWVSRRKVALKDLEIVVRVERIEDVMTYKVPEEKSDVAVA